MSSANRKSGDDCNNQSYEEIIEMKSLFKMLVESQHKQAESLAKLGETQANTQQQIIESLAKQAESLAKLGDTQANTQQQIIEILSRSSNSASDNHKEQGDIAGSSGVDKQEIADVPNDNDHKKEQPSLPELEGGYEATYVPSKHDQLYEAIRVNDIRKATGYLQSNPEAIKQAIAYDKSTALHMSVYWNRMSMVEEIVNLASTPIIFEYKRSTNGFTALHFAAFRGNVKAAMMMVEKNSKLTQIREDTRRTPLEFALTSISADQKEMVKYLYSVTRDEEPSPFSGHDGARLLCKAIDADFYDLALCLVKRFPKLVAVKSVTHDVCGLELLVRKPHAFGTGTKLTWWEDRVYSLIQVGMNSMYVKPVETNTCQSPEFDDERDDENPPESLEDTKTEERSKGSTTSDKSIFMPYLGRVSCITKLYNLKLMHQQANALLKQMIVELKNANSREEILDFFQDNPGITQTSIKYGIILFVAECLEHFGFLIWHDMSGQRMLDMAIIERNATIVNLICDLGDTYEDKTGLVINTDDEENTILHHAAKLASPAQLNSISGVALQIQRELQWLKGVGSIMPENDRFKKNKKGYTPQILFTNEHKELLKEGHDWMKDTSGSCMIVAALIATVAFAAAFTVPGGNISDNSSSKNGTPVFLGKTSFTVFAVADTFALFSSITSVLMFLAIYTSRYSEMDFLKSLPQKLILGLATLFISMAAILVAFCASLFIVVGNKFPRGLIPIALFGSVPVVLFAWLQLPLFYEMVRSTYWGSLFQKHKYIHPRDEKNKKNKKKKDII